MAESRRLVDLEARFSILEAENVALKSRIQLLEMKMERYERSSSNDGTVGMKRPRDEGAPTTTPRELPTLAGMQRLQAQLKRGIDLSKENAKLSCDGGDSSAAVLPTPTKRRDRGRDEDDDDDYHARSSRYRSSNDRRHSDDDDYHGDGYSSSRRDGRSGDAGRHRRRGSSEDDYDDRRRRDRDSPSANRRRQDSPPARRRRSEDHDDDRNRGRDRMDDRRGGRDNYRDDDRDHRRRDDHYDDDTMDRGYDRGPAPPIPSIPVPPALNRPIEAPAAAPPPSTKRDPSLGGFSSVTDFLKSALTHKFVVESEVPHAATSSALAECISQDWLVHSPKKNLLLTVTGWEKLTGKKYMSIGVPDSVELFLGRFLTHKPEELADLYSLTARVEHLETAQRQGLIDNCKIPTGLGRQRTTSTCVQMLMLEMEKNNGTLQLGKSKWAAEWRELAQPSLLAALRPPSILTNADGMVCFTSHGFETGLDALKPPEPPKEIIGEKKAKKDRK